LELPADLHRVGGPVEAEAGAGRGRQGAVPGAAADRIVGRELPARIGRVDGVLGRVPVDVLVGVEVLGHRRAVQPVDELCLLGHGVSLRVMTIRPRNFSPSMLTPMWGASGMTI